MTKTKEPIHLYEHFNIKKLFKITISPILMMVFISLYSVVDGFFIANFSGGDSYAGVNLIMPIICIIGGVGFMFGTGGSALSSKLLGQEKKEEACKVFSMMLMFTFICGLIISILGYFLIEPVARLMGSLTNGTTSGMVSEATKYGHILIVGQVFFMTQNLFQSYFMVNEQPKLGFLCTLFAGITNMIFDALFIVVFKWGVEGAAWATILGYMVGSIIPLIYFIKYKEGNIFLVKTKFNFKYIFQACFNGSSEFISSISGSIVGLVFNIQLLKYFGQNGVSAYGSLMYVGFIFIAIFIGYSIGVAPVVGYNYGANNTQELKNVKKKSLLIIGIFEICMTSICFFGAPILAKLFSSGNIELEALSTKTLKIQAFVYLCAGLCIFISSFFTALNNGLISALVSFLRTLVFEISFVFLFPVIFGKDGIWFSILASEILSVSLAFMFLRIFKKKYQY